MLRNKALIDRESNRCSFTALREKNSTMQVHNIQQIRRMFFSSFSSTIFYNMRAHAI